MTCETRTFFTSRTFVTLFRMKFEDSVGKTGTAITDASVAHALNATFSDTEAEAALNALGGKINSILAVLRTNGIIEA